MSEEPDSPNGLPTPQQYLYLLAWHDTLERLDVLLLEIRHLQVSIIHSLRAPALYLPLRKEEPYLWGKKWNDHSNSLLSKLDSDSIPELVNQWITSYPTPPSSASHQGDNKASEGKLDNIVYQLWHSSCWGRDQRRHYHFLCGLQVLKRQIFSDKLNLCRLAIECNLHNNSKYHQATSPKFLILRAGIIYRTRKYIEWLDNYQNSFNKAMDTGMQDHPRPSIERRRELGIYSDFLADRTKDILTEMRMLLHEMNEKHYRYTTTILHRWRHDATSRTVPLDDELSEYRNNPQALPLPTSLRFINTSYFMPERPDLQPVIAHEVAHCLIRDQLDDLHLHALHNGGEFSELLDRIFRILNLFNEYPRLPRNDLRPKDLTREIGADLLAASTKGFAFLYALFLEILGEGLEHTLSGIGGKIDLTSIYQGISAAPIKSLLARRWLLRIKLVSHWLRSVHHRPLSQIDECLLDGIEGVCNSLSRYLDKHLPVRLKPEGAKWRDITDQIISVVESSKAVKTVESWRGARSKDHDTSTRNLTFNQSHFRRFPRTSSPLPRNIQRLLLESVLTMKSEEYRLFSGTDVKINDFIETYGLRPTDIIDQPSNCADKILQDNFHRHLYDIPWQSSMLRAMDIIGGRNRNINHKIPVYKDYEIINVLHCDFPLGRELFYLALEFYLWHTEPATRRLECVIHLVREIENEANDVIAKIKESNDLATQDLNTIQHLMDYLQRWSYGDNKSSSLDYFKASIHKYTHADENYMRSINNFSAKNLIDLQRSVIKINNIESSDIHRSVQRASGHKLNALSDFLRKFSVPQNISNGISKNQLESFIRTLKYYLSIRSDKLSDEGFFSLIGSAIAPVRDGTKDEFSPRKISPIIVGRLSMAGSYNPCSLSRTNNSHDNAPSETDYMTIYRSYMNLIKNCNLNAEENESCKNGDSKPTWVVPVLGRYDTITWKETRFLCRCDLPVFPSDKTKQSSAPENWPTFFLRKEMGLMIHLVNRAPGTHSPDTNNSVVIAFLSITLQRRTYRLDFLYRLIKSINLDPEQRKRITDHYTLESQGHVFSNDDFAFLTDGWGDIVLVFRSNKKESDDISERMKDIMNLQSAIFQDFMVDRTELILSANCLDAAANNFDKWRIDTRVRLMEDNSLSPHNINYQDHLENVRKSWNQNQFCKDFRYCRTPGRLDFTIDFAYRNNGSCQKCKDINKNCFQTHLLQLVDTEYIDRIHTTIGEYIDNDAPSA